MHSDRDQTSAVGETSDLGSRFSRRWGWVAGGAAVVIGIIMLAFPGLPRTTIALVTGVYLIVAAVSRGSALLDPHAAGRRDRTSMPIRVVLGGFCVATLAAAIVTLNQPFQFHGSLQTFIWLGLALDGVAALISVALVRDRDSRRRLLLTGVASMLSAITIAIVPGAGFALLLRILGTCLVVLGGVSILVLALTRRGTATLDESAERSTQ